MDKEKEIEEMAKIFCSISIECKCCQNLGFSKDRCGAIYCMRKLSKAGYGNVKQAVKEFAEELKKKAITRYRIDGKPVKIVVLSDIDEVYKELYGDK